jgi:peroxiredoxin
VLGVSYDSPKKNRIFAEKNKLPFRLLSDHDHELAKSVGAARALIPLAKRLSDHDHELAKSVGAARALIPLAKRVSYLVGADGVVLATYPDVDPKTHAQEVLADYRALISSAE